MVYLHHRNLASFSSGPLVQLFWPCHLALLTITLTPLLFVQGEVSLIFSLWPFPDNFTCALLLDAILTYNLIPSFISHLLVFLVVRSSPFLALPRPAPASPYFTFPLPQPTSSLSDPGLYGVMPVNFKGNALPCDNMTWFGHKSRTRNITKYPKTLFDGMKLILRQLDFKGLHAATSHRDNICACIRHPRAFFTSPNRHLHHQNAFAAWATTSGARGSVAE